MKDHIDSLAICDQTDMDDPHTAAMYAEVIHKNMINTQKKFIPRPGYMKDQPDINERMRGILVDWLVEVHLKFKLVPETLYLTINLIDRFLETNTVM